MTRRAGRLTKTGLMEVAKVAKVETRNPNSQPRTREEGLHRRARSLLLRTREESHLKGTARTVDERVNLLTKILDLACLLE